MEGLGEEVLQIPLDQVRRLGELPADVEVLRVLPPWRGPPRAWVAGAEEPPLYLHIRHRYCLRVYEGALLCYGPLADFLERYRDLAARGF